MSTEEEPCDGIPQAFQRPAMSYLANLRLHFSGTFKASPSTVNNDASHFDVNRFRSEFQQHQEPMRLKGRWNPTGDHVFRLIDCKVTAAFLGNGDPVSPADPVNRASIADSNRRAPAKIADLDPQQQLVSTIFGMEVRLAGPDGADWVRGEFVPASLFDLWARTPSAASDTRLGAAYQSVLTDLEWFDRQGRPWGGEGDADWSSPSESDWLRQLWERCRRGRLSIKFNLDGCCVDWNSPDFCRGRITGTIGPAEAGEPKHFILGRHFAAENAGTNQEPVPAGGVFSCVAVIEKSLRRVRLDLGNALPFRRATGPLSDLGQLALVCQVADSSGRVSRTVEIAAVDYAAPNGKQTSYLSRAGILDLPSDRPLDDSTLELAKANPLALMWIKPTGERRLALSETPEGLYVRADGSAFRLSPGDTCEIAVHATRLGQPHGKARVFAFLDDSWLQAYPKDPQVATPPHALEFPAEAETDALGFVRWRVQARDPGNPRGYIDGQVYGVRFALAETLAVALHYPFSLADYVSFLVWSAFQPEGKPTWCRDIEPIFKLYANLYPAMGRVLDLGEYQVVVERRELLIRVFSMDEPLDPNFMPLTRDLSPAKREAILQWLRGDPPERGTPPAVEPESQAPPDPEAGPDSVPGGKCSAFARTLIAQRR